MSSGPRQLGNEGLRNSVCAGAIDTAAGIAYPEEDHNMHLPKQVITMPLSK